MAASSPSSTRSRAKRGDGARLRAEILVVAEELFEQAGSKESVSVRAIADRCSVTPPAIYLHFKDKDALFAELGARRFDGLIEKMTDAARDADDALDGLRACGLAYAAFGLEHPETYRAVMEAPVSESAVKALEVLSGLVSAARASGAFDDDLDVDAGSLVLWSGLHGITSLMLSFPDLDWGESQAVAGHLLDVLIEGLLST